MLVCYSRSTVFLVRMSVYCLCSVCEPSPCLRPLSLSAGKGIQGARRERGEESTVDSR